MYCLKDDEAQEVRSCVRYLSVKVPTKANAGGLIACLGNAMVEIGLENFLDKASVLGIQNKHGWKWNRWNMVNIGEQRGMMATMQEALPCMAIMDMVLLTSLGACMQRCTVKQAFQRS